MEIRNRLFPYPVLCVENDDYEDCSFDINTEMQVGLNDIVLNFSVKLEDNEELQWLIRDGLAQFAIHIECSSTAFRTMITFSGNTKTYHIPKSRVNNEIALLGLIVARNDIKEYSCKKLNEDYDEKINFEKGSILAYRNLPKIQVTKNYEELSGDNSFFTVIKRVDIEENENMPVEYVLNDAKIKILVSEKIYDEYIKFRMNPEMEPLLNTLILMPAIAYMIDEVRNNGYEAYENLYWYKKIKKNCNLQGVDFERDIIDSESSCIEVAQSMMQFPVEEAFDCISRVIEE